MFGTEGSMRAALARRVASFPQSSPMPKRPPRLRLPDRGLLAIRIARGYGLDCGVLRFAGDHTVDRHPVGVHPVVVGGTPFVELDDAGVDQLEPGEPGGDLRAVAQPEPYRGKLVPPSLDLGQPLIRSRMHDGDVAAGWQRAGQRAQDAADLRGTPDVVQDVDHHDRDRLVEVEGLLRAGDDLAGVAGVRVDVAGDALWAGAQQRAGVREHHRVVVDVDDTARRIHRLGDLVRIAPRRDPGADVEELA